MFKLNFVTYILKHTCKSFICLHNAIVLILKDNLRVFFSVVIKKCLFYSFLTSLLKFHAALVRRAPGTIIIENRNWVTYQRIIMFSEAIFCLDFGQYLHCQIKWKKCVKFVQFSISASYHFRFISYLYRFKVCKCFHFRFISLSLSLNQQVKC